MPSNNLPSRDYSLELLSQLEEALEPILDFLNSPEVLSDQESYYKLLSSIQELDEFIDIEKQKSGSMPRPKANLLRYQDNPYMPNSPQSLSGRLSDAIKLILGS